MTMGRPGSSEKTALKRILLLALVAGLAALAWHSARRATTPIGVVLITLDTTRADRLSPYGFMDVTMPGLERLAREGVLFHRATSVAPLTLPAHASILTGLLPPRHGVRDNADRPLAPAHTTLAEVLHGQGFRTGAFVGSVVVNANRGLSQGFEYYGGVVANEPGADGRQRRADEVMTDAIRWLDAHGDSRFFMWTHLYDPHRPYDPPEPFKSRHFDPYIGEIAFADAQIGRLLDALEHRRLLDRTLVIVTADHGESLGEHGERDHGVFIYESVLRVPLIICAPGVRTGRVDSVARLIDIMPTVLDVLGFELPQMDGVSLIGALRGDGHPDDLEAYAESLYPQRFGCSPVRALRDGRFKIIDAPRPELYDLERDPFEEHNLYQQRRAAADGLRRRLDALADRGDDAYLDRGAESVAPAELRERLAALGYVGSDASRPSHRRENLPDPKDCIGLIAQRAESETGSAARLPW
jgi:choline-sulfatase